MSYIEKERLIRADIESIENRVRHAFNQGYDLGYKEGKERVKPQEPKTGHWETRPFSTFCSECGFELTINNTNYCPNCGAKMVAPQESEVEDGNDKRRSQRSISQ